MLVSLSLLQSFYQHKENAYLFILTTEPYCPGLWERSQSCIEFNTQHLVLAHTPVIPASGKKDAGGPEVQGHLQLPSKCLASLACMRLGLKHMN